MGWRWATISRRQPGTLASSSDLIVSRVHPSLPGEISGPAVALARRSGFCGGSRSCAPNCGTGNSLGASAVRWRGRSAPVSCLLVDFLLQHHEGVDQRLGPRRAAGDVDVHRDVTVDALEHVVALLERAAGDGAGAHGDDVFRLGHLVVEADDLRRHFLGDGAGDDHQVRLARRGPEDLRAEAGEVVARHGGGDHLDGAAGEAELQRPDGILAAPVVEILEGGREDSLLAQLGF